MCFLWASGYTNTQKKNETYLWYCFQENRCFLGMHNLAESLWSLPHFNLQSHKEYLELYSY